MKLIKPLLSILITILLASGVVGLAIKEVSSVFSLVKATRVESWPVAKGQVLQSQAIPRSGPERLHKVKIRCEYEVDGEQFETTALRTLGNGVRFRSEMNKAVERFPEGSSASVFYDPEDPSRAYLEAGTTWLNYWAILAPMMGILLLSIPLTDRIVDLLGPKWFPNTEPDRVSN